MIIAKGKFKVELFGMTVFIIICDDEQSTTVEVNKVIKKYKETPFNHPCHGIVFTPDENLTYNYLFLSARNLTVNTITHETDHVRSNIIEFCSITENDNKETSANLSGYLNEKVFRFLEKKNIKFKY